MPSDSRTRLVGLLGVTAVVALALATLLPSKWVPRTGHWEVEHFLAYFATTIILCIASRRPIVVASSLIMFAGTLEALQGLTPDRFPDVTSALCGAAGVISAATLVALFIRIRARRSLRVMRRGYEAYQAFLSHPSAKVPYSREVSAATPSTGRGSTFDQF